MDQPIPDYSRSLDGTVKWVERHEVKSSDGKRTYVVARDAKGRWGCSCPVWKFRRQECKHMTSVARQIMINATTGARR